MAISLLEYAYTFKDKKNFYLIQILETISDIHRNSFFQEVIKIMLTPKDVVIDLFFSTTLDETTLLTFKILAQQLSMTNNRLRFINVNEPLKETLGIYFRSEKICCESFLTALETLSNKKFNLSDFTLIKSLVYGTIRTFFVQSFLPAKREESYFKKIDKDEFEGEISAITKIDYGRFTYFFSLSCMNKTLLKVLENLFQEKVTEIDEKNKDSIAELLNIILGQTRNLFRTKSSTFKHSIPSVFTEKKRPELIQDDEIYSWKNSTILIVPFSLDELGKFFVELSFDKRYRREQIEELVFK
ncbi:MAG: chemotaxis protein CheX [Oligoflexia bacterium]|nr:chemotaxis protein CheX [Oligoflexia bacterium]